MQTSGPRIHFKRSRLLRTSFQSLGFLKSIQLLLCLIEVVPFRIELDFFQFLFRKLTDRFLVLICRFGQLFPGSIHFRLQCTNFGILRDLRTTLRKKTLQLVASFGGLLLIACRTLHLRFGQHIYQTLGVKRMPTLQLKTGLALKLGIPKVLQFHLFQTQGTRHCMNLDSV